MAKQSELNALIVESKLRARVFVVSVFLNFLLRTDRMGGAVRGL